MSDGRLSSVLVMTTVLGVAGQALAQNGPYMQADLGIAVAPSICRGRHRQ